MINVKEESDGSFTISWNKNNSLESILNNWTEKDFIESLENFLNKKSKE